MTTNHALFFTLSGVRDDKGADAFELGKSIDAFWKKLDEAGEVESFHNVMLAAHGGELSGFWLVTGERSKLLKIRWENENFLKLHMKSLTCFDGYKCIDGYTGEGYDWLMNQWAEMMR